MLLICKLNAWREKVNSILLIIFLKSDNWYRLRFEIGCVELILRRRDTSVAHKRAKFDKSARNNYTMAGKLAITDDYYLSRQRRGWFITRASYFRGQHTSNLVRMGNTGGIDTTRLLNRSSSPPPLTPSLTGLYSYVPIVFLGVLRSRNTRRAIIFPSANKFSALLEYTTVAAQLSSRDCSASNVTVSREIPMVKHFLSEQNSAIKSDHSETFYENRFHAWCKLLIILQKTWIVEL